MWTTTTATTMTMTQPITLPLAHARGVKMSPYIMLAIDTMKLLFKIILYNSMAHVLTRERPMVAISPAAIDMAVCSPSLSLELSGKELTRPV